MVGLGLTSSGARSGNLHMLHTAMVQVQLQRTKQTSSSIEHVSLKVQSRQLFCCLSDPSVTGAEGHKLKQKINDDTHRNLQEADTACMQTPSNHA